VKVLPGQQKEYKSIWDALVKIGRTQGLRGLYNGLQVTQYGQDTWVQVGNHCRF